MDYSIEVKKENEFLTGMKDAVPVCMGYFAVSFTLGIAMSKAQIGTLEGFLMSVLNNASAGEYAGIQSIASGASYLETALMIMIANARYLLMSTSLTQKLHPDTSVFTRMAIGFDLPDELYALAHQRKGFLNPKYYAGLVACALPGWAFGTLTGMVVGGYLNASLLSALSVPLYAMFIATFVPPCKKDRHIALAIGVCFLSAWFCECFVPVSENVRTIVLTVLISAFFAYFFPKKETAHA